MAIMNSWKIGRSDESYQFEMHRRDNYTYLLSFSFEYHSRLKPTHNVEENTIHLIMNAIDNKKIQTQ